MIDILDSIRIQQIYSFDLNSLSEICDYLNLWPEFTTDEKLKYEEIDNIRNIYRNEDDDFWDEFENSYIYGELKQKGVSQLAEYLKKFSGNFYDIGSGNGKLLLHLFFISNFDNYYGIEFCKPRHRYAEFIKSSISTSDNFSTDEIDKKVNFIFDDATNVDFSDANVIFMNDLLFPQKVVDDIIFKIPKECHYISTKMNKHDYLEDIFLEVTWLDFAKNVFYLHKKN